MYWVAEVGSNHKGDKSLAYEYIRQFSQVGANVIKFQIGWTKQAQRKAGVKYNPIRYIDDWVPDLSKWCNQFGVSFEASFWSWESFYKLRNYVDFWKISSQVWNHQRELAKKIIAEFPHKTTFVSCGTDMLREYGSVPIYAVSKYPTYPGEVRLPAGFGRSYFYYGYSDHAHGIGACLLAVARGAKYIEKHVTLDNTDLSTRDTPFAIMPYEFGDMVSAGEEMRRHLADGT